MSSRLPPLPLRCDVPGCAEEIAVRNGSEGQRCFLHAVERMNEMFAARGMPPRYVDDEGEIHVKQ